MNKNPSRSPADDPDELPGEPTGEPGIDTSVQAMIHQLRKAVLTIGAVALITSLMVNWFIHTVNTNYTDQLNSQRAHLDKLQTNLRRYDAVLQQLAQIAARKPAMQQVFPKYGLQFQAGNESRPDSPLPGPGSSGNPNDVFALPPQSPQPQSPPTTTPAPYPVPLTPETSAKP
jgi:hypothetical protein